jgi:hypothetical protein
MTYKDIHVGEHLSGNWCIYSRLTREEKDTVNKIVYNCFKRNGFNPDDPWWEMNYQLQEEDIIPVTPDLATQARRKTND